MSCKPCASSVLAASAFSGGFSPATSSPMRWAAAANASTLCLSSSGVFACSPCPTSDCALAASVLTFAIAARYAVGDSWVVVPPPPPPPQAASRRTARAAMQAIPPRTAANLTDRPATLRPMFDTLSEKLQSALGDLRGRGVLDEEAISRAMREVRLALLEADVNFGVVKEFVAHVRERALDEELMEELAAVRREAKPTNVLLVLDAMTGQEAVNVAQAFQERIDFDGVVLTKLDGDARGGAALSVRAVTGRPIKLASLGEKLDALDWFHPDRMASRILGMGDVLTLIERAEAAIEDEEKEQLEQRMLKGEFSFDDFISSYKMLRRMGPLQGILKMIPGLGNQLEGLDQVDERQLKRVEAVILSMTPHERRVPHVIDASRRTRIAAGSGTTLEQINQLIEARKQMAKMMKMAGSGKMPQIPGVGMPGNGLAGQQLGQGPPRPSATRKSKSKRKKKARR